MNQLCYASHSVVSDSATPRTVAHQAPLSTGLSRQEYWSGLPFPSPGDLCDSGTELRSPVLQANSCTAGGFFTSWATREAPGLTRISYTYACISSFLNFLPIMCLLLWRVENITSLTFLLRMYNLNLILRKCEANPSLETVYKIICCTLKNFKINKDKDWGNVPD